MAKKDEVGWHAKHVEVFSVPNINLGGLTHKEALVLIKAKTHRWLVRVGGVLSVVPADYKPVRPEGFVAAVDGNGKLLPPGEGDTIPVNFSWVKYHG